ncbi:MAG: peroxidase-related enzyme [Leptolyngbya sp. SIOISBB]|nr:peroxidase-related enzyme [Leptolyngbya sp. SIOISBB]
MFDYQVGGSLAVDNPTYIERQSDRDLYEALLRGDLCYVLNSRQMGKSSLRLRTRHHIHQAGKGICASVDMTRIGSENITANQWYQGIAFDLIRSLRLYRQVDLSTWWLEQGNLSPVQKLGNFFEELILGRFPDENIFIFIDEIDSVQSLTFPVDDFFALVRYCYNQRVENPDYKRLTWALFGVASPGDLISDLKRTPFNVGTAIALMGFTFAEASPLLPGLAPYVERPRRILTAILEWTDGQPFLTQKLCALVQQEGHDCGAGQLDIPVGEEGNWVEWLVRTYIIDHWQIQDEPEHLRTVQRYLLQDPTKVGRLLGQYQQILLSDDETTHQNAEDFNEFSSLLLSGLVTQRSGFLRVHNRTYSEIFNQTWVQQQLANLRPYATNLSAWVKSNYQDESQLLRSRDLLAAQEWTQDKSLSDLDYQFLAASQLIDRRHRERRIVEILAMLSYRRGELKPYLEQIAIAVSELITVDWSIVTLCQDDQERILASSFHLGDEADKADNLHRTVSGYVFKTGCPLMVEDTAAGQGYGAVPAGYRAYLGVPLKLSTGEIVGTISLFHQTPRYFDDDEAQLTSIFAERAASAIENYQLHQRLQEMPLIQPIVPNTVSSEVQSIFEEIQNGFGMVPNLFLTMAHYPPLLKADWEKMKAVMIGGSLPRKLKETIALLISKDNECLYCVKAHSAALRTLQVDEDVLEKILGGNLHTAGFSDQEITLINFARAANNHPHNISKELIQNISQYGISDAELIEALGVMEIFVAFNKFLDTLDVVIDY